VMLLNYMHYWYLMFSKLLHRTAESVFAYFAATNQAADITEHYFSQR
jgi:hypothetical protein